MLTVTGSLDDSLNIYTTALEPIPIQNDFPEGLTVPLHSPPSSPPRTRKRHRKRITTPSDDPLPRVDLGNLPIRTLSGPSLQPLLLPDPVVDDEPAYNDPANLAINASSNLDDLIAFPDENIFEDSCFPYDLDSELIPAWQELELPGHFGSDLPIEHEVSGDPGDLLPLDVSNEDEQRDDTMEELCRMVEVDSRSKKKNSKHNVLLDFEHF